MAFRDEFGVYQFREVLADRVVIQAEMRSELRDIDGPTCIGDVPKDLVAGRVTQSSRLFLQSGRHPLNELPFRIVNFYCSLEMEFARATQQAESRQALEAGAMETMLQAIERFRGHGYELDLSAVDGGWLRCSGCGELFGAEAATIHEIVRFEGISNPDDQGILVAIATPCRHLGLFSAAYGVYTSADDSDVLHAFAVR